MDDFFRFSKKLGFGFSWSTLLWYRCYYPHRSRDALSPVCGIFCFKTFFSFMDAVLKLMFEYQAVFCHKCFKKNPNIWKLFLYSSTVPYSLLRKIYFLSIYTRRYGPLRGPTSRSCGGLRPSAKAFFLPKKSLLCCFGPFLAIFGVQ